MSASRYLIISPSGVVENAIIYDPQHQFVMPDGYELVPCTRQADIGWIRNPNGTFSAPPEPQPES